ncbi:MAG: cache domain-containing protein [Deltaproteobacteria bacterium]|nr:cache domain-containing protein [Deltaproteobacteria bacterium]
MRNWIRTVRFRLSMLSIAIVVLANLLFSVVTLFYVNRIMLREVNAHIHDHLVTADGIFESYRKGIADTLRLASMDATFTSDTAVQDLSGIVSHLEVIRREAAMDVLWWVGTDGRLVYRAGQPGGTGDDVSGIAIISRVIAENRPLSGTILVPSQAIGQVSQPVVDGGASMAMAAAVPVARTSGGINGVIFGARLLNQRFEIVDQICDVVFASPSAAGAGGRVSISQGATRISTTRTLGTDHRPIGTTVSDEVRAAVIERGEIWTDRAFVIDRWFVTSYQPIRDPDGAIIGSLGLGLPEDTLLRPQRNIIAVFMTVVTVTTLLSLLLIFLVTQGVLHPITRITAMLSQVAAGDLTARVKMRPKGEIGLLVEAVNGMADALSKRQQQLETCMHRQLGHSEKLASIGRLAAGIAHEVNNPLTGVLTFASMLKKRPTFEEQDRQDLDIILHETTRVREIVKGLLEFAREVPSSKQPLDLNEVIGRTLPLLKNQKEFYKINVVERLAAGLPKIEGDQNQIQQVLLNLCLNACEAMPSGGQLTIATLHEHDQVQVSLSDTGCGIKQELLDRIFEPFFTTKPVGKGTGLGLSVSYGIIHQHNGTIEVNSAEGMGATFTVTFPAMPPASDG